MYSRAAVRLARRAQHREQVALDQRTPVQLGGHHLSRGTVRRVGEHRQPLPVEGFAVAGIGQPERQLHDVVASAAGRREHGPDVDECWGWGTPAHGWSSTPTRDLVQAVLGVTPAEPGFATARIAPAYGAAARLAGSVPTPSGPITVDIDADRVSISTPIPATLVLPDGREHALPAGETTVAIAGAHTSESP